MKSLNRIKSAIQDFCDKTTMHGFFELYYTKSVIWKAIWFSAIALATGMATYQIGHFAEIYWNGPTTTNIQTLSIEPLYPSLQLCYTHFIYWLDWNRARKLGFDKPAMLFGLSYLSDVFSEAHFNITEAEKNFKVIMEKNGWSKLTEMFIVLSYRNPPGISVNSMDSITWGREINYYHGTFCYVATHKIIKKLLSHSPRKNRLSLHYDRNYVDANEHLFITYAESHHYEATYMKKFFNATLIDRNHSHINLSTITRAPILHLDRKETTMIGIVEDTFWTTITVSITLYNWRNTTTWQCATDKNAISKYEFCDKMCYWKGVLDQNASRCLYLKDALLMNMETLDKVCRRNIVFLRGEFVEKFFENHVEEPSPQFYNACTVNCKVPCQQWRYSQVAYNYPAHQAFNNFYFPIPILIEYPEKDYILELNEVLSQTWESILGNVGGSVGLWLGGSILSLLQMIYLLCCGSCDERACWSKPKQELDRKPTLQSGTFGL